MRVCVTVCVCIVLGMVHNYMCYPFLFPLSFCSQEAGQLDGGWYYIEILACHINPFFFSLQLSALLPRVVGQSVTNPVNEVCVCVRVCVHACVCVCGGGGVRAYMHVFVF